MEGCAVAHILVSGLVNTETTVRVRQFPIEYYPIDYPFFGVNTAVSGVGCNLSMALRTLGDRVTLYSMVGRDFSGERILKTLADRSIDTAGVYPALEQTPASAVLYDETGRRQIYCDLKDIQQTPWPGTPALADVDLVAACNIGFSRPLLRAAKAAGKPIATDVHVLRDIRDEYNREFMEHADILFLSDEGIRGDHRDFLRRLGDTYGNRILVLGRGSRGAAMYLPREGRYLEQPAAQVGPVVNTVGAGDALFSAFLHFYVQGLSPEEALCLAQRFAAAKIRCNGAAQGFLTEEELNRL